MRFRNRSWAALIVAVVSSFMHSLPALAASHRPITGFARGASDAERAAEARLAAALDPNRVDRDFRELTREPHVAGSPRNNALAQFVADAFTSAGLEDVVQTSYDVLMSYPKTVEVGMVEPRDVAFKMAEDVFPEDADTAKTNLGIPYHGFSASGEVTADVVYARNGNPEDYEHLKSLGVDVRGKLVLVRYSVPYSYRGFKAFTAEKMGAAGLLIYSDPKDDGFVKGEVFPKGPWGPIGHIQRGAITYDFLVPGDPLTPGWASVEGARRITEAEAISVPHILSVPIKARDAREILLELRGPEAPEDWRGALDVPYRVGPGPAKVHLKLDIPRPVTKIINVTARVRGTDEPEQVVLLGNHRDAWIFGGVDPSSGTATMLELARALGSLVKSGWRPHRTIMLANWDAEEFALTGSTEWGEQHLDDLREHLVAYFNVDSSTSGRTFSATASGCLSRFIEETIDDVVDPATGRSLRDVWKQGRTGGGATALASGSGVVAPIGSGSDHTVFLNLVGAPALDMTFDGDYGVYHSAYDDYFWVTHFGDPGLIYMTKMAEVWGRMAMRAASADIIPWDYQGYGRQIGWLLDDVDHLVPLRDTRRAAKELSKAGKSALKVATHSSRIESMSAADRAGLNRAIMSAERALCDPKGLPDRPWFKHLIYACRYTYAALLFPGLTEAVEQGDVAKAGERAGILADALRRSARTLRR
ncbi:MAG TPA: M28 family metallopeptidase [Patescibacteria group bacterium]|nr:M28 family metallopeptidase [Patescibacteria group bacterium]